MKATVGNFDDILKKKINQMGISRQVEAVGVVEKATEEIAKYIPREDFEVVSFNRGTLKVKVINSITANELQYHIVNLKKTLKEVKNLKTLI